MALQRVSEAADRKVGNSDETTPLLSEQARDNIAVNATLGTSASDARDTEHASSNAGDDGLPTSRLVLIMSGIYIATVIVALDSTLIATLGAPIAESYDALALLPWFTTAFFLAVVISQPLTGKLSDIYGRYASMTVALLIFCLGNIICACAKTKELFVLGRGVAGLGGGSLTPIFVIITADLVPLRRRGVWQGFGNVAFSVGASIGAPLGGIVNDTLGWRWAFWLQAPPTILAVILITIFPPPHKKDDSETAKSKFGRIDWAGGAMLTSGLVLLLLGLNAAGNTLPWQHPLVISSMVASMILLVAFLHIERFVKEPIVPVTLLTKRTVICSYFANWLTTMSRLGLFFYSPIFFLAQGYSTTQLGLVFLPSLLAIGVGSLGTGLLSRYTGDYYFINAFHGAVFVASMVVTVTFSQKSSLWAPCVIFCFIGGSYAGILNTTMLALTATVEQKEQAVITSAAYIFRNTGTAIGISISSVMFQGTLRSQLATRFGHDEQGTKLIPALLRSTEAIRILPTHLQGEAVQAFIQALKWTFFLQAILGTLGVLASLFMQRHKLHSTMSRRD